MAKKAQVDLEDAIAKSQPAVETGQFVEEYCVKPTYDQDGVQSGSGIGVDGREYPDPLPMSVPIGYRPPPDLMTMIRQMIRSEEAQRVLNSQGVETFEEADDFDIPDDPIDALTPYEELFYPKEPENGAAVAAPASSPPAPPAQAAPQVANAGEPGVASPPAGVPAQPQVKSPAQSST